MAISSAQKCLYQSGHAICCATVSPLDCCIDLLSGYKSHTYFLRIISFLQKSHRDLLSDLPPRICRRYNISLENKSLLEIFEKT